MTVYLLAKKPVRRQFRTPRRARPSGVIVVHTAEGIGASNVASFICNRSDPGSYHDLVDDRESLHLVDYGDEAFGDGTGSNPHACHLSFATRAADWSRMPAAKREAFLQNGARAAARCITWLRTEHGIVVPPRRISRAESNRRVPGFIGHGERDPGRRSDPGSSFAWNRFLGLVESLIAQPEQEEPMLYVVANPEGAGDWATDLLTKRPFGSQQEKNAWCQMVEQHSGRPPKRITVTAEQFRALPTVRN